MTAFPWYYLTISRTLIDTSHLKMPDFSCIIPWEINAFSCWDPGYLLSSFWVMLPINQPTNQQTNIQTDGGENVSSSAEAITVLTTTTLTSFEQFKDQWLQIEILSVTVAYHKLYCAWTSCQTVLYSHLLILHLLCFQVPVGQWIDIKQWHHEFSSSAVLKMCANDP